MTGSKQFSDGAFTPPQFPLDPFPISKVLWAMDPSTLPVHGELSFQSKIILVLGEPPLDAIAPLLTSPHLVSSLVVLATARSYTIPPNTSPAVALLRLGVPLASSESAAYRLVAVFQWAERVASAWKAHPAPPQFQELMEDGTTAGYITPPQRTSWFGPAPNMGSKSTPPSPASSQLGLSSTLTPPSSRASKRASVISRTPSSAISVNTGSNTRFKQRAFDALFDFLPPDAPDRHLLKHAILVTTVSRPFLSCTLPSGPPPLTHKSPKRFSLSFRSSSAPLLTPDIPAISPAHIVHFIPPARAALLRPLESFCLSFSFPGASCRSAPSLGLLSHPPRIDMGVPSPAPRPFIMPPAALSDVLQLPAGIWTLAELILCGALDGGTSVPEDDEREFGVTKSGTLRELAKSTRAWLNGVEDLIMDGAEGIETKRVVSQRRELPDATPESRPRSVVYSTPRPMSGVAGVGAGHAQPMPMSVVDESQPKLFPSSTGAPYSWHTTQPLVERKPSHARASLKSYPSSSSSSHSHSSPTSSPVTPVVPSTSGVSTPWPTPPGSSSSSTSNSPDLIKLKTTDGNLDGKITTATGLLTPPDASASSLEGSLVTSRIGRKRKGLFAWMKRGVAV
ncbi:hypothetical protein K439DRAFT_1665461 [Ramaria rubella]|nr:hypothetical protein K439DRAFT_1665461 [Ramaria rubella]